MTPDEQKQRLREIASVFLRLGTVAFGGPAAHVALMEEEIVHKRQWLSRERFIDLYGATNLIPGPNSTELAIHLGYERGGGKGLILAGVCFITPAMLIVLAFAWLYVRFGTLPAITSLLYGIKPIIIAIVAQALYRLAKTVLKDIPSAVLAALAIASLLIGLTEIAALFLAGLLMMLYRNRHRLMGAGPPAGLFAALPAFRLTADPTALLETAKMSVPVIFLTFLKIGSVLYGSGYVLLSFLESELVDRFQVMTTQQLLDAVAVGQFTPGPVFTTATFVGYLIQGLPGALAATVGIFLPSFLLVYAINPLIPRMRASRWVGSFLDGVNIASLALMAVVAARLALAAIVDPLTIVLALVAFVVLFKTKLNSVYLILAGGVAGYLAGLAGLV